MDDALAVRVIERTGNTRGDANRIVDRQLAFAIESGPERLASHVWHDVEDDALGRPGIEERDDPRVLQGCGGRDLCEEPVGAEQRSDLGMDDLERDLSLVPKILG